MKRTTRRTVCCGVILLCSVGSGCATAPAPVPSAVEPGDFELTIETTRLQWRLGEVPEVFATIRNNTDDEVRLVPALDGSSDEMRYPYVTFALVSPEGAPAPGPLFRCGNTNNIVPEDLQVVPAGGTFNPLQGWTRLREGQFPVPGPYQIQLVYDTRGEPKRWYGFMGPLKQKREIRQRLTEVPRMVLTSNTLEVEIVDNTANGEAVQAKAPQPGAEAPEPTYELQNAVKANGLAWLDAGDE